MMAALAGIGRTSFINSVVSYSWIRTKDVWEAFGTLGTVVFAVVITILSVLFLTMCMGLCGTIKRTRCCIVFAVVLMTLWGLFFIGVGVASLIAIPHYFDKTSDSKCLSLKPFVAME